MFLASPLAPLTGTDLALAALLALAVPAYVLVEHLNDRRLEREGRPRPLLERYRQTLIMLWGLTLIILVHWLNEGRPLAALGLTAPPTLAFALGAGAAIVICAAYSAQWISVRRSQQARDKLLAMLEKQDAVSGILPNTEAEIRRFRIVALTAGITEEILFRGFLIWALAHWMHVWAAAGLALLAFTLAHLYQESPRAIGGVFVAGAVMTALAVLSGSLLPAMLVHIVVDIVGGEMVWAARRGQRARP